MLYISKSYFLPILYTKNTDFNQSFVKTAYTTLL